MQNDGILLARMVEVTLTCMTDISCLLDTDLVYSSLTFLILTDESRHIRLENVVLYLISTAKPRRFMVMLTADVMASFLIFLIGEFTTFQYRTSKLNILNFHVGQNSSNVVFEWIFQEI